MRRNLQENGVVRGRICVENSPKWLSMKMLWRWGAGCSEACIDGGSLTRSCKICDGVSGTERSEFEEALVVDCKVSSFMLPTCGTGADSDLFIRDVIERNNDVSQTMAIIKDCSLKIEDILPYFPDFVRIGEFKVHLDISLGM